jgi:CheY-like chemotaxis protein/anti-sigma regulatory factor (Ser/Thr protein kinase)
MTKILITDDDAIDRELARRCLRPLDNLEIAEARDGREALDALPLFAPDLLLTDLRMPRIDGLELVERALEIQPLLPIVLMTSSGSEKTAVQAIKAGAASYVPKTDLKHELVDTIQQVLVMAKARLSKKRVIEYLGRSEVEFQLENDPDLVCPTASYLEENLERIGFGDAAQRNQVEVALMEAMSNAIIHGNLEVSSELRRHDRGEYLRMIDRRRKEEPYASRRLTVTASEGPELARYVVEDEGPGFDVSRLPDPRDPENLLHAAGRGVLLVRTLMDDVEFNEKGNRVTLVKRSTVSRAR